MNSLNGIVYLDEKVVEKNITYFTQSVCELYGARTLPPAIGCDAGVGTGRCVTALYNLLGARMRSCVSSGAALRAQSEHCYAEKYKISQLPRATFFLI